MEDTESYLRQVPLFAKLSANTLAAVAKALQRRTFPAGATLIRKGQVGTHFFLLASGTIGFVVDDSGAVKHTTDTVGSFFGEVALMNDSLCSATAITETGCECYVLDKLTFDHLLKISLRKRLGLTTAQKKMLASMLGDFDRVCTGNRRLGVGTIGGPANHINTLELQTITQAAGLQLQQTDILAACVPIAVPPPRPPASGAARPVERASRATRRAPVDESSRVRFVSKASYKSLITPAIGGISYEPTSRDKFQEAAAALDADSNGTLPTHTLHGLLSSAYADALTREEIEAILSSEARQAARAASSSQSREAVGGELNYADVLSRAERAVEKMLRYGPVSAYRHF